MQVNGASDLQAAYAAAAFLPAQQAAQGAATRAGSGEGGPGALTDEERRVVERLKARDREVRAHEQAHRSAGAGLTGPANYDYVQGPDGRRYAVGGEVSIDTSGGPTPEATIAKMEQVKRAALAPAQPSGQDLRIAAQAEAQIQQAQREKQQEESEEQSGAEANPIDAFMKRATDAYGATQQTLETAFGQTGEQASRVAISV